jgi:hypothetical protein
MAFWTSITRSAARAVTVKVVYLCQRVRHRHCGPHATADTASLSRSVSCVVLRMPTQISEKAQAPPM